ncbi:MAG: DUF2693 domain-containing protein [Rikenellaceae bacterium]|nr:DUF2693 domain-containing protein [Rikenellaceae bacterium]
MNALVITDTTAVRMNVIAQRTQNLLIAGAKAMMIESLKDKLRNGVAHFIFQKRNGEYREMFATTNPSLVTRHINGRGVSRELYATTAVFDCELGEWRSFRWESIVKVF